MILLMLRILFMATANQLLGRWVCQPFTSKPNVIFFSFAGRDPDNFSPKYFAQNHYFDHITIYDQLSKIVICPDRKGNRHNVGSEARKPDIQTDTQTVEESRQTYKWDRRGFEQMGVWGQPGRQMSLHVAPPTLQPKYNYMTMMRLMMVFMMMRMLIMMLVRRAE